MEELSATRRLGWRRLRLLLGPLVAMSCALACSPKPEAGSAYDVREGAAGSGATLEESLAPRAHKPWLRRGVKGDPEVRFVGRAERLGPMSGRYAWSGAGFVARFEGTGLRITLEDEDNWHTVMVDGERALPLAVVSGRHAYTLVDGLSPRVHEVRLLRRTEALFGVSTLLGVEVMGGKLLAPTPPEERLLEVVGDSITAGYGNLGQSTACHFSPETQDHGQSYASLAATELKADLSTVAWSGRGIVRNYGGEAGDHMPSLYRRTLPQVSDSRFKPERGADAVVINLGTNDFSTEPDPSLNEFAAGYALLLGEVRRYNPDADILCTIGPMLGGPDAERAIAGIDHAVQARRAAGDSKVERFELTTPNAAPGCDWHPSVATHQKMAAELVSALRRLGW